jgi:hypothetical protein
MHKETGYVRLGKRYKKTGKTHGQAGYEDSVEASKHNKRYNSTGLLTVK